MPINTPKNSFLSYIIILLALFILVFFTKNIFWTLQQSLDLKDEKNAKVQSNEAELSRLNNIKKDFSDNTSDATVEISKFTKAFDDQAIINHVYDYVEKINENGTAIALKSVNFSKGKVGDLWFNEVNVNVTARFGSEQTLMNMISYFIDPDANYTFFIDSLSYPAIWKSTSFQTSIPLKLFYK